MGSPVGIASLATVEPVDARRLLRRLTRRSVGFLFVVAVLLIFLVSPMRLDAWGVPYDTVGGSAFAKIHPGTWAALLALAIGCLFFVTPRAVLDVFAAHKGLLALAFAWLALIVSTAAFLEVPFTPLIDVFLLPMAIFVLFALRLVQPDARLGALIHLLMTANAIIGISEHMFAWRLTPYPFAIYDSRSTALLGHPLANASLTGAYILALVFSHGRDLPRRFLPFALALQSMAMIAFGGRSATVLALAVIGGAAAKAVLKFATGRRVSRTALALGLACVPLALIAATPLLDTHFLNSFVDRFVEDRGSAEARFVMFRVLAQIPLQQILFGVHPDLLTSLQAQEDIVSGIESFWVGISLLYGLLLSSVFFVALGLFCLDVCRACRASAYIVLAYFFAVSSSSVSLAAKSCGLAILVLLLMVLLRPLDTPTGARRRLSRASGATHV